MHSSCKTPDAYFATNLQELDAYLSRILQDRRLSCKSLAYSTDIFQESYKIEDYLARILQNRRLSCKNRTRSTLILQESYKIDAYLARILQARRLS